MDVQQQYLMILCQQTANSLQQGHKGFMHVHGVWRHRRSKRNTGGHEQRWTWTKVDMNIGENNDAWTGNLVRAAENMCIAGTAAGLRFIRGKCKNRENAIKCTWPPLPCGWLRCAGSWDNFLCSRFWAKYCTFHISALIRTLIWQVEHWINSLQPPRPHPPNLYQWVYHGHLFEKSCVQLSFLRNCSRALKQVLYSKSTAWVNQKALKFMIYCANVPRSVWKKYYSVIAGPESK